MFCIVFAIMVQNIMFLYDLTQWEYTQIKQEWAEHSMGVCVCVSVLVCVDTLPNYPPSPA